MGMGDPENQKLKIDVKLSIHVKYAMNMNSNFGNNDRVELIQGV